MSSDFPRLYSPIYMTRHDMEIDHHLLFRPHYLLILPLEVAGLLNPRYLQEACSCMPPRLAWTLLYSFLVVADDILSRADSRGSFRFNVCGNGLTGASRYTMIPIQAC